MYKESVLLCGVCVCVVVEMGGLIGWDCYVGFDGVIVMMLMFGVLVLFVKL